MDNEISIVGVREKLISIQRDRLKGLNADILLRFSFYTVIFNNQELCILKAKNSEDTTTPLKYKKITERIEAVVAIPVVILLNSLTYYERERFIQQGVYFIISDKYAFLPSLIINTRAHKKDKKMEKLTPAAQYILLYYLLREEVSEIFTIRDLEKIMPYNYLALSRAVTNLEDCKLCRVKKDNNGTKLIHFEESKRSLWENASKFLSSPVKKILYTDAVSTHEDIFSLSGVNALSRYSHLNSEQYSTMAVWEKNFDLLSNNYNAIEGLYKIEIWKYPVTMPLQAENNVVDKLSLYLSMKNDPDSRIEKELEIMIKEMKW